MSQYLLDNLSGAARSDRHWDAAIIFTRNSDHSGDRLDLGVKLGELGNRAGVYSLEGYLARKLADPANDEVAALIEEVSTFHHRLILETPSRLRSGALWDVAEHDGPLIARSSRIMEPFVFQIIDWAVPSAGPLSLLEIGCGSGTYLRRAAERNPLLTAVGVEMQADVADVARRSIAEWGLADRVRIETGDVRDRAPGASFDLVTLYNAIYYFAREERVAVLAKLASFLEPGGKLVLSTSCRGGSPGMQMLNVWTSSTRGFGPLPTKDELVKQAAEAGFVDIETKHVIPGEPYVALIARKRGARASLSLAS